MALAGEVKLGLFLFEIINVNVSSATYFAHPNVVFQLLRKEVLVIRRTLLYFSVEVFALQKLVKGVGGCFGLEPAG